jgi:hypothetical protein
MDNQTSIGGRTFSFGTIPPTEAIKVEVSVARVIGEPLFKAFMDYRKTGGTPDSEAQSGAAAIGMLLSKMDADDLIATMTTVFKYVSVDGKRANIDADFAGRNKELWLVFIAALRFNFSDFLPAGLLDSLAAKASPASN